MIAIAALAAAAALSPAEPIRGAPAVALFELVKSLSGEWTGQSTKGWVEAASFQVLARGTTVLETTRFTSPPEPGMATAFHLDGDRALLTHFCEAGKGRRVRRSSSSSRTRRAAPLCHNAPGLIQQARNAFLHLVPARPTSAFKYLARPIGVTVSGPLFMDRMHRQEGVAPNGAEIHPVLRVKHRSGNCR